MSDIFNVDGLTPGINTILLEEYYPLEGNLIVKDKNEKIIMFEQGIIYRNRHEIFIETEDIKQLFKIINLNEDTYIYEFIAKKKIKIEDEIYNNVYIKGKGKFTGPCEISFDISSKVKLYFLPLFNDDENITLSIW